MTTDPAATERAALLSAGLVATVVGANWALATFGVVWGMPAGVFVAGLAFTLRDLLHDVGGRRWVLAAIAAGTVASVTISPAFAVASGVAFAASELADMAVFTPLRKRRWLTAVAASNVVGLVVDSVLFLWLAFGSLNYLAGQIAGKGLMTGLALVVLLAVARHRRAVA